MRQVSLGFNDRVQDNNDLKEAIEKHENDVSETEEECDNYPQGHTEAWFKGYSTE